MKKVVATFKSLNWEKSKVENKPVYDTDKEMRVVASTKSENNFIEELTAANKAPTSLSSTEFFFDKSKTETAITNLTNSMLENESEEVKKAVIDHIMKALDGACIFWKDLSRKKK